MIRWLKSLFAWRTIYRDRHWALHENKVTKARRWRVTAVGGVYSPYPLIDEDGNEIPPGPPPPKG